jgi:hypothetical protein
MTLFDPDPQEPRPGAFHKDDPETSKAAATDPANMVRWGTQRYKILLVFMGRSAGLTPDAVGAITGIGDYNHRRRCSELQRDGYLSPTGEVRDGCRVLKITPAGERALRAVRKPVNQTVDYSGTPLKEVP